MEELAEKYAMDKSDAAREAFLAEVALDFKKRIVNGNDGARHDKSKEKKNNKDSRKAKDVKVWNMFISFYNVLFYVIYLKTQIQ